MTQVLPEALEVTFKVTLAETMNSGACKSKNAQKQFHFFKSLKIVK